MGERLLEFFGISVPKVGLNGQILAKVRKL